MKKYILLLLTLLLLGCSTKKQILLYQDIEKTEFKPIDEVNSHPKIQINDILSINTTALNPDSVLPFTFNSGNNNQNLNFAFQKLSGYLVNSDGEINFPQLGKIYVKGKTTQEVQLLLEEKLSVYIKNPTVNIRIVNFKITVQGEVKRPGTFEIVEENMTLPQVIGKAGDLTINGRRRNVLIYRQEGEERRVKRIDLTQTDWMNTEYFYVRPNDIIYVEPNKPKIKSAGFIGGVSNIISVVSFAITLVLVITRL